MYPILFFHCCISDESLSVNENKNLSNRNFDISRSISNNLSLDSIHPSISNCSVLNDETDSLHMNNHSNSVAISSSPHVSTAVCLSMTNCTTNNNQINNSISGAGTSFSSSLIYTNSSSNVSTDISVPQPNSLNVSVSRDQSPNKIGSSLFTIKKESNPNLFFSSISSNNETPLSLSYKNDEIFNNSSSKLKVLTDYSVTHPEDFTRDFTSMLDENLCGSKIKQFPSTSLKCSGTEDLDLDCEKYVSFTSAESSNSNNIALSAQTLTEANLESADSNYSDLIEEKSSLDEILKHDASIRRTLRTQTLQSDNLTDVLDDPFKPFWCNECDKTNGSKCNKHRVQSITDKRVCSRARASLPSTHLVIKNAGTGSENGVFTKRGILNRTRFGPLEGRLTKEELFKNNPDDLVFATKRNSELLYYDISDESSSNWMRFVRKAEKFLEINCVVFEEENEIFFLTTVSLSPHTELRLGYSKNYAEKYNLPLLLPTKEEQKVVEKMRNTWKCFECDESFECSSAFQDHLACHDEKVSNEEKIRKRKGKLKRSRLKVSSKVPNKKLKTKGLM